MENLFNVDMLKKSILEDFPEGTTISFSYLEKMGIIFNHLETIFGVSSSAQGCLDRYYQSNDYKIHSHIINKCSDLELINADDIKNMVIQEEQFKKSISELLKLNEEETADAILKKSKILGLIPNKNSESLFRYLIKDTFTNEETDEFYNHIKDNLPLLKIITHMLSQFFFEGYFIENPGTQGVISQQKSRYLYRGENAYYSKSKAGIYREVLDHKDLPYGKKDFINKLRLWQGVKDFHEFDAIEYWPFCQPNELALMQHYGVRTPVIDITSDLKTALFFACCRYDSTNKKWIPLTEDEFKLRSSRNYIYHKLDGNSRYGVLYRIPYEISDYFLLTNSTENMNKIITPIGNQPFMRCKAQHGYMMGTNKDYDLYKDERFDKFRFKLTDEICQGIYKEMDCGNKIYPKIDIPDIESDVAKINTLNIFSRDVFNLVINDDGYSKAQAKQIEKELKTYGIVITDNMCIFSPDKIDSINKTYTLKKALSENAAEPKYQPKMTIC